METARTHPTSGEWPADPEEDLLATADGRALVELDDALGEIDGLGLDGEHPPVELGTCVICAHTVYDLPDQISPVLMAWPDGNESPALVRFHRTCLRGALLGMADAIGPESLGTVLFGLGLDGIMMHLGGE